MLCCEFALCINNIAIQRQWLLYAHIRYNSSLVHDHSCMTTVWLHLQSPYNIMYYGSDSMNKVQFYKLKPQW